MSPVEIALRDICADPALDIITLVRSPAHGWQANVKRAYRGHSVHHDPDPVVALMAALTAPALAPVTTKLAPSPTSSLEDIFG